MSGEINLDWGRVGAQRAAARRDVVAVVDALSFSTTVALAAARGATVFPCWSADEAAEAAAAGNAIAAARRAAPGAIGLSPLTASALNAGDRVALDSPNGATCRALAAGAPSLLVGAFANASATAEMALRFGRES